MHIFRIIFFVAILLSNPSYCSSLTDELNLNLQENPSKGGIIPLMYKISKGNISFDLIGTNHGFPYQHIDSKVRSCIEDHDVAVFETETTDSDSLTEKKRLEQLKPCQKHFPATEQDTQSFKDFFESKSFDDLDQVKKDQFRMLQSYEICFAVTLVINVMILNEDSYKAGMDQSIVDKFVKMNKTTLGLLEQEHQVVAFCEDKQFILFDKDEETVRGLKISELFVPSPPADKYPSNLEELKADAKDDGDNLDSNRNLPFVESSIKIAEEHPKERVIMAVGLNHLPGMFSGYKKRGWTITQLFTDLNLKESSENSSN